jgi:hypothetical protein
MRQHHIILHKVLSLQNNQLNIHYLYIDNCLTIRLCNYTFIINKKKKFYIFIVYVKLLGKMIFPDIEPSVCLIYAIED